MTERGRNGLPTLSVRFMVPWRPDGGHRDELWAFCKEWWSTKLPAIEIVEGTSPDGPFNRAAAINDAARGSWDIGVVLDADVIADPWQVRTAIENTLNLRRVTFAFDHYIGLNLPMTNQVLAGYDGKWTHGARLHNTQHESSIVVVPRKVWDTVGGFDERFRGWGQEDVAFTRAARILCGGTMRTRGIVWHLFHKRSPERTRSSQLFLDAQELGARYRRAYTERQMRALLDERKVYA